MMLSITSGLKKSQNKFGRLENNPYLCKTNNDKHYEKH